MLVIVGSVLVAVLFLAVKRGASNGRGFSIGTVQLTRYISHPVLTLLSGHSVGKVALTGWAYTTGGLAAVLIAGGFWYMGRDRRRAFREDTDFRRDELEKQRRGGPEAR